MSRRNLHAWVSSGSMPFGDAITARRNELGWTRTRVAKAVDVSARMLADYEKGIAQPSLAKAVAIATTLRMSLDVACGLQDARPFSVAVDGVLYAPVSGQRVEDAADRATPATTVAPGAADRDDAQSAVSEAAGRRHPERGASLPRRSKDSKS